MIIGIFIGLLLSLGLAGWALWQIKFLKNRFDAALGSADADSLERTLANHMKQVRAVDHRLSELNTEYERLAVTNSLASQKISLVRFNPFGDTGGDQSSSLAVLDAHNSGYVLTTIHGREGTRVYIKPVDNSKSKYPLSAEEQQALAQAIKRIPQMPDES
ncbi:MAG: DUF4446 family protein [Candidatus Saccharibacteria bacterium]